MHPPEALPLNKFKFPVSFRSNSALPVKIQTATGTLRGGVLMDVHGDGELRIPVRLSFGDYGIKNAATPSLSLYFNNSASVSISQN